MNVGHLMVMSPDQKDDLYQQFCVAFILSRFNYSAQNRNLKVIDRLAKVWDWDEKHREELFKRSALRVEQAERQIENHLPKV